MFTGIVEDLGVVAAVISEGECARVLSLNCGIVSQDAGIGDSIAINGCCLTIVGIDGQILEFQAGRETLNRTNLGQLETGDVVNLERAIKAGDRLGGHYVSGHIDSVGSVCRRIDEADWSNFWFSVPSAMTAQMASKGSIAVDGVSLTLVDVTDSEFSVALIPHTLSTTTLGHRQQGDRVNIETDILAKYVQQQLARTTNTKID